VVVLRAGERSGALHTVAAARAQGRPILAWPGEVWAEAARGCIALLASGVARACLSADDALRVIGLLSPPAPPVPDGAPLMSVAAKRVYGCLTRSPRAMEELEEASGLEVGALLSALCELELLGLAMQSPGKKYERV
jgi:DNA processing protein